MVKVSSTAIVPSQTTLGTEICGSVAQTALLQGCHVAGDYSVGLPDRTESLPADWITVPPALNAELVALLSNQQEGFQYDLEDQQNSLLQHGSLAEVPFVQHYHRFLCQGLSERARWP